MSLLNSTLQTAIVRLRDINGNVTVQKLHSRIFDAYEAKSLVLEALSPEHQAAMALGGGRIPPGHPSGLPLVIDNWADLTRVHSDRNVYQLLPRRAKTNAAYQVLRSIAAAPGSPFGMEHRMDPLDVKFVFRAADYETKQQFNARSAEKVGNSIWFDGVLRGPKDTGLVLCYNTASPAQVNQIVGAVNFLREWVHEPTDGDRHKGMKDSWRALLGKRTHLFVGTNSVPAKDLVAFARGKSVHLYAKRGAAYSFCA